MCRLFSLLVSLSLCSTAAGDTYSPVDFGWSAEMPQLSCEGNKPVQDFGTNNTLDDCKAGCPANPFCFYINWDKATGRCISYFECNNPNCQASNSTTVVMNGKAGRWEWKSGCHPTPAPVYRTPTPPVPVSSSRIVRPCFGPPCNHWNDTDGNRIESHAAGMLQAPDGRWYWYGESKKTPSLADHGVNCYSAPDISGPWKNEGQVFHQSDIKVTGQQGPFIVERPKVLYNEKTSTYVMWFHLDTGDYKFANAGVATSKQPQGPFTFVHNLLPDGKTSLDMSLFRDPQDGQAYFIRSIANQITGISRLTPDYLNSAGLISNHSVYEGMALFRHPNGTYYMVGSHLTGWNPNPLQMFRAAGKTLDDPQWVDMGNPTGDSVSWNSQPTYVIQFTPQKGDPYFVYMGDNWVHAAEGPDNVALLDAAYVWLPFWFKDDRIELHQQHQWDLDDPFPTCPTLGNQLHLAPCGRDGQTWNVLNQSGPVALAGSNMCVTYTDASQLVLGDCSSAPKFQYTAGHLQDASSRCMDVSWCGSFPCFGEKVGLAACHGEQPPNQAFALSRTPSGDAVLQSKIDGYGTGKCLTACA